jgi:hypothetical protein
MGRRKRNGTILPKNNLIQDSEGNEENTSKTKINDAKEPNDAHKNKLKEILQVITESFMEMLLDMVN